MTKVETMSIMAVLKEAYPHYYRDKTREELSQTVNLWAEMFASDPAQIVTESVKALICTLKFPPTIADVKEKIRLITQPETMTEMEAWGKVLSAIQSSNYHAQDNFYRLPPVIQKIVGSPNQLREWAMMESDVTNSVIQSNFMRSYKARVAQEKEYEALPDSTKNLMLNLSQAMLEVGND